MGIFWRSRDDSRVLQLEEKIQKLTRDFQSLELEWNNFFDKARRLLQRITKRAEVVEKAEEKEMGGEGRAEPIPLSPATGRLTDRQKEIQQLILRRRAGG